jgi:hypothetical protein
MSRYHEDQRDEDKNKIDDAIAQFESLRAAYSDLVAIPEIVTLHDVCGIALDTTKGPQQVGDVCSREEIVAVLKAIEDNPCGDIALIAQLTLNDYRQTKTTNQE